jgi:hypothetical protein
MSSKMATKIIEPAINLGIDSKINSSNKSSNINTNDFFDELKIGVESLSGIFAEYKKKENIEIELRIGQLHHDGFKPGLGTKDFYNKIKNTLDTSKSWIKIVNTKSEELCANGLRRMTTFNGKKVMKHQCIRKERILNNDLTYTGTPYDIRVSVSKEIEVADERIKMGILRKKNRHSYYYKDYRIDLTIVEQIENGVSSINYEVEVEFLNIKNEVSDKYRSHSGFLLMRDMINMCEKIEEDSVLEFPEIEEMSEE